MVVEGKVVEIIDDYTVVINKGMDDGVEMDMRFIIYELGEALVDPETGNSLGKFERVKAKVEVVNLTAKYATARTYETETFDLPRLDKEFRRPLPLDSETRKEFKTQKSILVKKGDLVKEMLEW